MLITIKEYAEKVGVDATTVRTWKKYGWIKYKYKNGKKRPFIDSETPRPHSQRDGRSKVPKSSTRLYRIWKEMKARCYTKSRQGYRYYGAKGIKVCKEWKDSFDEFAKWSIENGYKDDLSIDRIDPDKDYTPNNCRWVPIRENILRKRPPRGARITKEKLYMLYNSGAKMSHEEKLIFEIIQRREKEEKEGRP